MEQHLNKHCLLEIFKYLNTLDLLNLAVACCCCNEELLDAIIEKKLQIVRINLNDTGDAYAVTFFPYEVLTMRSYQTIGMLKHFGHYIRQLTLGYIYFGAHEFINQCYNLHTLTLDHVNAQRSILPIINQIEHLNVCWCSGIFGNRYGLIQSENIRNLKHISCTHIQHFFTTVQRNGLESITVYSLENNNESCIVQLILNNSYTLKSIEVHTNNNYVEDVKKVINNAIKTVANPVKVYVYSIKTRP